jgi:hypothetical protein
MRCNGPNGLGCWGLKLFLSKKLLSFCVFGRLGGSVVFVVVDLSDVVDGVGIDCLGGIGFGFFDVGEYILIEF